MDALSFVKPAVGLLTGGSLLAWGLTHLRDRSRARDKIGLHAAAAFRTIQSWSVDPRMQSLTNLQGFLGVTHGHFGNVEKELREGAEVPGAGKRYHGPIALAHALFGSATKDFFVQQSFGSGSWDQRVLYSVLHRIWVTADLIQPLIPDESRPTVGELFKS